MLRAAALFVCLLATSFAQAATAILAEGEAGDWVLGGEQRFITPADGEFQLLASPSSEVDVYFLSSDHGSSWLLRFGTADGSPLEAGTFVRARRFASGTHPALDITGESRGCNETYGQFVVRELVRAADGSIERFAADFEQHCERSIRALFGGVRINSDVPYSQVPPMMHGPTFIEALSRPGDWILEGESRFLEVGNFNLREEGVNEGATLTFDGVYYLPPSRPPVPTFWTARFGNASGEVLTEGTYEGAQRYAFRDPGHPGLDVSGDGRVCNTVSGRFVVLQIVRDDDGLILSFAADFEQHCNGAVGALLGGVRFNSDVPYVLPPPPTASRLIAIAPSNLLLATGAQSGDIIVRAVDDSSVPVPGISVQFSVYPLCGQLAGDLRMSMWFAVTDGDGYARVPHGLTGGGLLGACPVTAQVPYDEPSVQFVFQIVEAKLAFTSHIIEATPGAPLTIEVDARDPDGHPLQGVPIWLRFNCEAGNACVSGSQTTGVVTTDASGRAIFSTTAGAQPGSYSVTANSYSARDTTTANILQRGGVGFHQDMWWGGPEQNGWGMSIVQHDDKLFSVIYAYDAGGSPTWFVMPAGTWDETNTVYSGLLYIPHGAPYFAYDTGRFGSGPAVGSARITFVDANHATLEYTINGQSGRKDITRQLFGPPSSQSVPERGDMWWGGGSQNGWGVAVLQQFSTLFTVWFTYDASGSPTWFVLPSGTWTASDTYEGRVYRTTGSPWIGTGYNASQLQATDVGSFRLRFSGINATLDYQVEGHSGSLSLERQPF